MKEITPVLFFGYDNRFVPETSAEPAKHDDTAVASAAVMGSVRKMDFRPRPITETPVVQQDEEQVEVPKVSSATEPALDSVTGSPTSPSESPEDPASAGKAKTETLVPPLL